MSEKTMITGAKKWAERCKTHAGEEVQNGVVYVHYLLYKLAQLEAENKTLREELNELRDQGMIAQPYYASRHELIKRIDALLATPEDTPISDIPASP